MNQFPSKNYFTMPNEIFSLGLDASEIAVYALSLIHISSRRKTATVNLRNRILQDRIILLL